MPLSERNASFSDKPSAKAGLAVTQRALALSPKAIERSEATYSIYLII